MIIGSGGDGDLSVSWLNNPKQDKNLKIVFRVCLQLGTARQLIGSLDPSVNSSKRLTGAWHGGWALPRFNGHL